MSLSLSTTRVSQGFLFCPLRCAVLAFSDQGVLHGNVRVDEASAGGGSGAVRGRVTGRVRSNFEHHAAELLPAGLRGDGRFGPQSADREWPESWHRRD